MDWRGKKIQNCDLPNFVVARLVRPFDEGYRGDCPRVLETLGQVDELSDAALLRRPCVGRKTLRAIRGEIARHKSETESAEREAGKSEMMQRAEEVFAAPKAIHSDIATALRRAGWTPWHGGPCPVDEDSFPIVLTADGSTDCERASDEQWEWNDLYPGDNVIGYKVML